MMCQFSLCTNIDAKIPINNANNEERDENLGTHNKLLQIPACQTVAKCEAIEVAQNFV